jgi:hypothetical protein
MLPEHGLELFYLHGLKEEYNRPPSFLATSIREPKQRRVLSARQQRTAQQALMEQHTTQQHFPSVTLPAVERANK